MKRKIGIKELSSFKLLKNMIKHLISIAKWIVIVLIILALFTGLQLMLPQGEIELTKNQAIAFVIGGIITIAIAIKATFD